jgi:alpha-glucosidase
VAADLGHSQEFNHKFWRDFRKNVKEANPEAIILAEHYGDPSSWLEGDQWDTVMNYDAFMEPVSWFLTGMEKHSDVSRPDLKGNSDLFFARMTEFTAKFSMQSLLVAMNELSNHDHSRFLTRTNGRVGRTASAGPESANYGVRKAAMMAAVIIQMTWLGAPTVYYGDEAGVRGWTDPDNRRTYPWGKEDHELILFHKEAIRIHKDYDALRSGGLIYLVNERNLIGYGRFDEKDKAFVLVQAGGMRRQVEVPVWRLEMNDGETMASMIYSDNGGFDVNARIYVVKDGKVTVDLEPDAAIIIKSVERGY